MPTPAGEIHTADLRVARRQLEELLNDLVASDREVGIQVAAYLGERCVLDACAGRVAATPSSAAVGAQTLFPVFSVAKAVVSLSAHIQAEKGLLDLDAPIARYWPEFAAHGKEHVTSMHVLTHRAALPQMPPGSTMETVADWDWITGQLARSSPLFEPGTRSFYHAMTYAWLLGEIVRRTDPARRPFERFAREEILDPLRIEGFFFTVEGATAERVAQLSGAAYPNPPDNSPMRQGIPAPLDLTPEIFNRIQTRCTLLPAVGAYANAHSVARLFALFANGGQLDGVRLLSTQRVRSLAQLRANSDEPDPYLGHSARLSAGYWLGGDKPALSTRNTVIYSLGAGGSLGWADPDYQLSVAIAHNKMYPRQRPEVDPQLAIGLCVRKALRIPE
jgi:CubicO group peptidase (beta-lactamase class C family)